MNRDLKEALVHKLLAMADDELILGHRDSEWTGYAPILEEDIAFANIALDELGHAKIWYRLLAELAGKDPETFPEQLVFFRDAPEYCSAQLVELPKGDWAFTILRQYMFDAAEPVHLEGLLDSWYPPLAQAAAKIRAEEIYHYRHTCAWVQRLGLGTEESHRRTQHALNQLWYFAYQLFQPLPDGHLLIEAGLVPELGRLRSAWEGLVRPQLETGALQVPEDAVPFTVQRDQYTEHRVSLLREMQKVARLIPGARW